MPHIKYNILKMDLNQSRVGQNLGQIWPPVSCGTYPYGIIIGEIPSVCISVKSTQTHTPTIKFILLQYTIRKAS